jgi:molecular chaperone GrpE
MSHIKTAAGRERKTRTASNRKEMTALSKASEKKSRVNATAGEAEDTAPPRRDAPSPEEDVSEPPAREQGADPPEDSPPPSGEADVPGETETPCEADGERTAAGEAAIELDKYLRLAAEYDNYRKRSAKERDAMRADARAETIGKFLPVYDNLARALRQECADEAFYKGVEMTMAGLREILSGMGVEEIPSVGAKFDPDVHRALMHTEDPELGEGVVTEEIETGFTLAGKVIRFAAVIVAN